MLDLGIGVRMGPAHEAVTMSPMRSCFFIESLAEVYENECSLQGGIERERAARLRIFL
jgi:hypothetical protein